MNVIDAINLHKEFHIDTATPVQALKGVDLRVKYGDFISVMGRSGSGKSTLLHILGCMEYPTAGRYTLDGRDVTVATDKDLCRIRANRIGFVFQSFNLLPYLNVYENVELPFLYSSEEYKGDKELVLDAINQVGLMNRIRHRPAELSGGEKQRVAIARAIVKRPAIILADEPTGNLDYKTSCEILRILQMMNATGSTILMVTHDPNVASYAHRIITLIDGELTSAG